MDQSLGRNSVNFIGFINMTQGRLLELLRLKLKGNNPYRTGRSKSVGNLGF
jgi:hypothetical protein